MALQVITDIQKLSEVTNENAVALAQEYISDIEVSVGMPFNEVTESVSFAIVFATAEDLSKPFSIEMTNDLTIENFNVDSQLNSVEFAMSNLTHIGAMYIVSDDGSGFVLITEKSVELDSLEYFSAEVKQAIETDESLKQMNM